MFSRQNFPKNFQMADKYKITSPLVRAMFYDTNIMQAWISLSRKEKKKKFYLISFEEKSPINFEK